MAVWFSETHEHPFSNDKARFCVRVLVPIRDVDVQPVKSLPFNRLTVFEAGFVPADIVSSGVTIAARAIDRQTMPVIRAFRRERKHFHLQLRYPSGHQLQS